MTVKERYTFDTKNFSKSTLASLKRQSNKKGYKIKTIDSKIIIYKL